MRPFCFAVCFLAVATSAMYADRPNIVVFYTDDHGYADLSCQDVLDDIRTPNVDALAAAGVRALHGYSTAPQCVPSRAGLLTGKFQARFGLESNKDSLEGFNKETTIAQRLQDAGYVTAQFGKWHLGPTPQITRHGFKHVYAQNSQAPFSANITMSGKDRPMGSLKPEGYHVDACSRAAASVIERYKDEPLFLYVAYRAPHVPLDATPKYLQRFPGEMAERRRQALAMLSAVDDGVGLVVETLKKNDLFNNTLIFYIGDNGAPLKIHKLDAPGGGPGWDGSLNDPLNGEKGMLAEGGMHTPFVVAWPGKILGGQEYPHPISALDVAATATAIAGIKTSPGDLDGVNLIPHLSGEIKTPPHDALMWRWISQSAIRVGNWKLLRGGQREYLYDLETDLEEKQNLASKHPEIADRLRKRLRDWADELSPPGLATEMPKSSAWNAYFDFYLDGKHVDRRKAAQRADDSPGGPQIPWKVNNGKARQDGDTIRILPTQSKSGRRSMLARNGLRLKGPVDARIELKPSKTGRLIITWRTKQTPQFAPENQIAIDVNKADQWQDLQASIPNVQTIIHLRIVLPEGTTSIRSATFRPSDGSVVTMRK